MRSAASLGAFLLFISALPGPLHAAKEDKWKPVIFGVFEGNAGCVILKQQYGVRKKWLLTGTVVAIGEYEVVQTFRYDISQTKFKGQDGVNDLNRIGNDHLIKFVVIPRGYTDLQLNEARDECEKGLPPLSDKPATSKEADTPVGAPAQPPPPSTKPVTARQAVAPAPVPSSAPLPPIPPEPVYMPMGRYTDEAKKAGVKGTVRMWVVVDESGKVTDARIIEGLGYGLDEEALKTVKTWKFKPTTKDGKLVSATVKVEMPFGPE